MVILAWEIHPLFPDTRAEISEDIYDTAIVVEEKITRNVETENTNVMDKAEKEIAKVKEEAQREIATFIKEAESMKTELEKMPGFQLKWMYEPMLTPVNQYKDGKFNSTLKFLIKCAV